MRNPTTPAEWREAAVFAAAALMLDSARQYGLVTGGPIVNVDRCVDVLAEAKGRGVEPTKAEIDAAVDALVAGAGAQG